MLTGQEKTPSNLDKLLSHHSKYDLGKIPPLDPRSSIRKTELVAELGGKNMDSAIRQVWFLNPRMGLYERVGYLSFLNFGFLISQTKKMTTTLHSCGDSVISVREALTQWEYILGIQ